MCDVFPVDHHKILIDPSFVYSDRHQLHDHDQKIVLHAFLYRVDYNQQRYLRQHPNRKQIFGRSVDELYVFSMKRIFIFHDKHNIEQETNLL